MRRSGAPSIRRTDNDSTNLSLNENSRNINPVLRENVNEAHRPSDNVRIFKVVWGKRSSKKHKTFEDDGFLELKQNVAKLRDSNGKYLGSTKVNDDEIEDGFVFAVGAYETEIGELVPNNSKLYFNKRSNDDIETETENKYKRNKKTANPSCFIPKLTLTNTSSPSSSKGFSYKPKPAGKSMIDPLIMTEPDFAHQWKFNTSRQPIKEVCVAESLTKLLRPHQREGVRFLYECLQGFRNPEYCGCILADEMGLGKTFQCIAVCHTMLKQGPYGSKAANKILIVSPSSLVNNWNREIEKWLSKERIFTFQFNGKNCLQHFSSSSHIPFLLVSYEMFMKHFTELKNVAFDVVICDEAHRLKNTDIKTTMMLNQIACKRRVLLTGTPIQNDLQEFYALMNFANPGLLGAYPEFKRQFEVPITLSQKAQASLVSKELGEDRINELNRITSPFILRRTQEVINGFLPKKHEFIVFCKPSELQKDLFQQALSYWENELDASKNLSPLQLITFLKKICNHPSLIRETKKENSLLNTLQSVLPSWQNMGPSDSGKLSVVQNLLVELVTLQEKIVLISYSTKTLDMLQGLLEHFNYSFCRLDGTTPSSARSKIVEKFNDANEDIFVFLLSAKAGGVGLNLIGASRLVLFDNDWNPASDLQAMSRIWRDGQKKDVFIYRLITAGSIEEKIFQRQMSKTILSESVVDIETKVENIHLTDEELKDLFSIQTDYNVCATHELLECDCQGNGKNITKTTVDKTENESNLRVYLNSNGPKPIKLNQLTLWEHYKEPIEQYLLKFMCIPDCIDDILFMFKKQNVM